MTRKRIAASLFLTLTLSFVGCADKDAFSKFDITRDEAAAFDNLEMQKVTDKQQRIYAVVGAVDLSVVYPQRFNDSETFYMVIFAKDKKYLENFKVLLNGRNVTQLTKIPANNEYAHLLKMRNEWSAHYLARFQKGNETKLQLVVELANGAKALLEFQKTQ